MITVYTHHGRQIIVQPTAHWPDDIVWVDLFEPDAAAIAAVEERYQINLPEPDELSEIQVSSQLYANGDNFSMSMPIMSSIDTDHYDIGAMNFTLTPKVLITMRFLDPKPIGMFVDKFLQRPDYYSAPSRVLIGIIDIFVDRSADVLERIGDQMDKLSRSIFSNRTKPEDIRMENSSAIRQVLQNVGRAGDLLGIFRSAMTGFERVTSFLINNAEDVIGEKGSRKLKSLAADMHSLEFHADSLQQRIEFLLDATLGVISIEQNKVMQVFTVAAVTLMPPTLLAGIWGMNFKHMPELEWPHGYPLAIAMILASALVPLVYFRRKGWI